MEKKERLTLREFVEAVGYDSPIAVYSTRPTLLGASTTTIKVEEEKWLKGYTIVKNLELVEKHGDRVVKEVYECPNIYQVYTERGTYNG